MPADDHAESLKRQRTVKRMLATKARNETARLDADVAALTAALVALGAEEAAS